jgi:hypothetical protein
MPKYGMLISMPAELANNALKLTARGCGQVRLWSAAA